MYKSNKSVTSGIWNLINYIDGFDIYNAYIIQELQRSDLSRETYEIKNYQYRPDLIAKDYYGSENYTGLVMLQSGLTLSNFKRGLILSLITKNDLDKLLGNL